MSIKNKRKAGVLVDHENRQKDDYYNTPTEATEALLAREAFSGRVWEPACGEGHISRVLEARGHTVYSSDLVNRGYGESRVDFLMEYTRRTDNIITNPPFKLSEEFIHHSLNMASQKIAMFLPLAYLAGTGRKRDLWDKTPIARIYVFSWRVPCLKNGTDGGKGGGGMINFAWFVWEHGYVGAPQVFWL